MKCHYYYNGFLLLVESLWIFWNFIQKEDHVFYLQSSAYLLAQRLNVLQLQVNYLECPSDFQTKISSYI